MLLVPLGLVQVEQQVQLALQVLVPQEQLVRLAMTDPRAPQVLVLPEQQERPGLTELRVPQA